MPSEYGQHVGGEMNVSQSVSSDAAKAAIVDALRLFVGQGRRFSFQALEAASGVKARNLYAYAEGQSQPPLDALLSIMRVLPPEFSDMVLAPAELSVARRDAESIEAMALVAKLAGGTSAFAHAAQDGRFDHQERAKLRPIAREIAVAMNAIAED